MKEWRNDMTHNVPIVYKGIKNNYTSQNQNFISLTKLGKKDLKKVLENILTVYNYAPINEDGFLYAKGSTPVLLIAHMDTTPVVSGENRIPVRDFYEETTEDGKHVITSPQGIGGDDRCGVYTILQILRETDYRPYILFCEDEEIGCVGSQKFCGTQYVRELTDEINFMIQIDRRGSHDLVFYDDDNEEWHQWCESVTEWKENWGSCSDISFLAPASGVAAVNISSGYYDEHTLYESVVLEELRGTIECVKKFLMAHKNNTFDYKEMEYENLWAKYGYNRDYSEYYGDYPETVSGKKGNGYSHIVYGGMWIMWEEDGDQKEDYIEGKDVADCFWQFFQTHGDVCFNDVLDYEFY